MKTFVVDVTGYGHVSVLRVKARNEESARSKAAKHYGIRIEVR